MSIMNGNKATTVLLTAILISIMGISFIGQKQKSDKSGRVITVEGNVEREVMADNAEWTLCFEHIGANQEYLESKVANEKEAVNKLLLDKGIQQQEIEIYNYVKQDYSRRNRDDDEITVRYRVGYFVQVKTKKVNLVANLKNNISKLIDNDMGLIRNTMQVSCSNRNDINRELTRLAAAAALKNAENLSEFLKIRLGKIVTIDTPRIWTESNYPEMDGGMLRVNMAKGVTSTAAENNASDNMTKQKIHAALTMRIAIK